LRIKLSAKKETQKNRLLVIASTHRGRYSPDSKAEQGHCERSEAISHLSEQNRDCFTMKLFAMTDETEKINRRHSHPGSGNPFQLSGNCERSEAISNLFKEKKIDYFTTKPFAITDEAENSHRKHNQVGSKAHSHPL
jgi:hypothetical protein